MGEKLRLESPVVAEPAVYPWLLLVYFENICIVSWPKRPPAGEGEWRLEKIGTSQGFQEKGLGCGHSGGAPRPGRPSRAPGRAPGGCRRLLPRRRPHSRKAWGQSGPTSSPRTEPTFPQSWNSRLSVSSLRRH
ncbi:uncharacterized protein LOC130705941 isoform X1 [Balaenoptera acutorostrata]|uniref:Uncharacterized protein LOC130705941 isoform X1 n=1 Tax=Balaenoptera acutorostrata TaxID=9767 RepID=A0ABM3SQY7_BALAC|nr:uncharacterized protein LOC130705941 isoform X1 [Balaenoptera acutorostrata]